MKLGTDILKINRIRLRPAFLSHVLSENELRVLSTKSSWQQRREFVAGRWAAKEAIIKAWPTGLVMPRIDIELVEQRLQVSIDGIIVDNLTLSISHEKKYVIAAAILND